MKKTITVICLTTLALAFLSVPAFAELEIVFAISTPKGAMGQVAGQRLTDLANARLAGKAKIVYYDTAQEIRPWIYETVAKADQRLVGDLETKGMKVNHVDRAAFVKASAPVYELFDKEVPGGKAMVETILKLAE
jgi:TRAP-type C4-dicarboxylate transport system substrate-binding protein